ncbi:MAG TPA: Fe-S cluster assembly protein SufD [Bacteroidetes bacterium]|nr:Fe-S cluster assembly protein SufD [Bacteroidota bacterium]
MVNKNVDKQDIKNWYLSEFARFEQRLHGGKSHPFHNTRKNAIAAFSKLGFPHVKMEEWRYTDISQLLQHRFQFAGKAVDPSRIDLAPFLFEGLNAGLLVFINGQFSPELSKLEFPVKDVFFSDLAGAFEKNPSLIEDHLTRYADSSNSAFTALNTAFTRDGAVIYLPDNRTAGKPVDILNISDARDSSFVSHPRNLIVVGKNSRVEIVESYYAVGDGVYFNNPVCELVLAENAVVDYLRIQKESEAAFHISTTQVFQQKDSVFTGMNIDLGGGLVRNSLNVLLNGENCQTKLYGYYMVSGSQFVDNHTYIDHARPHGTSNQLYKGILADSAKGVFSGIVHVRPDAQKTNAFQQNKNLLLSDNAEVSAKPQLKIYADDVRCTHGATVGQIDEKAVFYLRQRGVKKENALAMLRYAFAADVLDNIGTDVLRLKVDRLVKEKFARDKGEV